MSSLIIELFAVICLEFPNESLPKSKIGVITLIVEVQTLEVPLTVFISLNLLKDVPASILLSISGTILVLKIVDPLVKCICESPLQLIKLLVYTAVHALIEPLLTKSGSITIVSEAHSGEELLAQVKSFDTSLVLIDYTSSGFNIDIIPKVLSINKRIRFVAITAEQSPQTLVDALRSGISSYIKKDCDVNEILMAVKETGNGNKFFCGQILESIQRANIDVNDLDFESFSCEAVVVSERENEIIILIAEGLTNEQIAI